MTWVLWIWWGRPETIEARVMVSSHLHHLKPEVNCSSSKTTECSNHMDWSYWGFLKISHQTEIKTIKNIIFLILLAWLQELLWDQWSMRHYWFSSTSSCQCVICRSQPLACTWCRISHSRERRQCWATDQRCSSQEAWSRCQRCRARWSRHDPSRQRWHMWLRKWLGIKLLLPEQVKISFKIQKLKLFFSFTKKNYKVFKDLSLQSHEAQVTND